MPGNRLWTCAVLLCALGCLAVTAASAQTFTDANAGLPGIASGGVAWTDYDNDGDLDLAMMGTTTAYFTPTPMTKLFQNDGGVLTEAPTSFTQLFKGRLAWGDYDRDGDLDLAIGDWDTPTTYFSTV